MERFNEIVNFKHGVKSEEILLLTPSMLVLLGGFLMIADVRHLPIVITSITEHVDGRVSKTHADGRAVDVSTRGWSAVDIKYVVKKLNLKYKNIAAISKSDYKPRAAVYHKGTYWHIHLQVRP